MSTIWQNNLNKLIQYKSEFGHVNVPKSYSDRKLARLVITLRQQKRNGTIKSERELSLHQIGFDFEPLRSQWLDVYYKVVEFYKLNGHASPNRRSENDYECTLADWVHRMHKLIRNQELSEEKVEKLKLINIDGNPADHKLTKKGLPKAFEKMFGRLNAYIKEYNNIIYPDMSDPVLYSWVLLQQQRVSASLITPREYKLWISTHIKIEKEVTSLFYKGSHGE